MVARGSIAGPLKLVSAAHMERDLKQVPQVAPAHIFSLLVESCDNSSATTEAAKEDSEELHLLLDKYKGCVSRTDRFITI